jgi:hypothetical protein
MVHTRCMLDKQGYTHAHALAPTQICNIYCFSMAKVVTRTRPVVTSYAHFLSCFCRNMSQADSRRSVTMESLIRCWVRACEIRGRGLFQVLRASAASIIPPLLHLYIPLVRRTSGRSLKSVKDFFSDIFSLVAPPYRGEGV